jgi:hypothetical protein
MFNASNAILPSGVKGETKVERLKMLLPNTLNAESSKSTPGSEAEAFVFAAAEIVRCGIAENTITTAINKDKMRFLKFFMNMLLTVYKQSRLNKSGRLCI